MTDNPWQVESIQAFYWLKCPECPLATKEENHFEIHASKNHPLSYVYFKQKHKNELETCSATIKEEPVFDKNLAENLEVENSSLNSEYQDFSLTENSEFQDFSLAKNSKYQEPSLDKMSSLENEVHISDQPNFKHTAIKQEHIEITETVLNEDPLDISHGSECKKTFPLITHLNRHIKCIHNSLEKPKKTYNCTVCNKCFSYPSLLNRHMKQVHESSTNCLICDKNFSFPSQLKNHMAKKHSSMSKKIDYALNFDTGPIQIPKVVDYQQEKIDSETEKDEIAKETSLSNNEQTKKSRRKQKIALRKDF